MSTSLVYVDRYSETVTENGSAERTLRQEKHWPTRLFELLDEGGLLQGTEQRRPACWANCSPRTARVCLGKAEAVAAAVRTARNYTHAWVSAAANMSQVCRTHLSNAVRIWVAFNCTKSSCDSKILEGHEQVIIACCKHHTVVMAHTAIRDPFVRHS